MSNQYIPDLTERFPEGFGGVDLTDRYFPSRRSYSDMMAEDAIWAAMEDDYLSSQENVKPRRFEIGDVYRVVGVYGGVTNYKVEEIDRTKNQVLLSEIWEDLDGMGTRPAQWHKLVEEDGNEKALEYTSINFGDMWIEAYEH